MRMGGDQEPVNPEEGDCWFDPATGCAYIWMGSWFRLVSTEEEFQGVYVIAEEP